MRIMVNKHSYLPIFGHYGWNVPCQAICAPSVLFLAFLLFVFFFNFICLFVFFLSFFYWRDVWIMEWWSFTILQRLPVSSTYCFHHTLQNAFVLRHDVTKYFTLQSAMESSPKSACKSAFGIGTSFEAITGQLDVLSRSHYSVFYVSWSFKMQLFENIWKDLQFFC